MKALVPLLMAAGAIGTSLASKIRSHVDEDFDPSGSHSTGARFLETDGTEYVRVIVGINSSDGVLEYGGNRYSSSFERSNAVALTIPYSEVEYLENHHPQVDWIEEDVTSYAQQEASSGGETTPWGIHAIQGDDGGVPSANPVLGDDCFSVCVVDSGVMLKHADLPFRLGEANVQGVSFGVDDKWYDPEDGHGKLERFARGFRCLRFETFKSLTCES